MCPIGLLLLDFVAMSDIWGIQSSGHIILKARIFGLTNHLRLSNNDHLAATPPKESQRQGQHLKGNNKNVNYTQYNYNINTHSRNRAPITKTKQ